MKILLRKKSGLDAGKTRAGILFVLPSILIFSVFVFIPLINTFVFSTLNFDMMFNNVHFLGFSNYVKLFHDQSFFNALYNTVYYTLGVVPIQLVLALLVAVAVSKQTKLNSVFRSIYFLPAICSMTIISIVWTFLIDKDIGIVSYFLSRIGIKVPALLKDPFWAMPTIILVGVWKNFGFNMVILVAGLQGIPDSYYEAAEVDGASSVVKFFKITIPMLMPTLTFVVVNSIISSFQVFDQVFVMTRGGPLFKTETVVQYIYKTVFSSYDMGYASTVAVALFILTICVSLYMFKVMRKRENDYE